MEAKLKHLELIQAVINRMAFNSFSLKGWSVILVSALFALAASDPDTPFFYLAYFPNIAFWVLDAYFLQQERLFRKLYDAVRVLPEEAIDFSMNTAPYTQQVQSWLRTAFSRTLIIFHGIVTLIITLVVLAI